MPQQPLTQATPNQPFAEFGGTATPSPTQPQGTADPFAEFGGVQNDTSAEDDSRNSGEIINDVGNRVIVPKVGESFADTMARAAAHGKTVTPDQLNREERTMPGKAATTLAAAPVIGAAGAAALAAPGEAMQAAKQALSRVLPTTIEHVKAIGAWAHENPIHAYLMFQILKELLPGVKKAAGIIHGLPSAE